MWTEIKKTFVRYQFGSSTFKKVGRICASAQKRFRVGHIHLDETQLSNNSTSQAKTLELKGHDISGHHSQNQHITQQFDISSNEVEAEGAQQLANALKINSSLQQLNISHACIDNDWTRCSSKNTSLQQHYVCGADIEDENAVEILGCPILFGLLAN